MGCTTSKHDDLPAVALCRDRCGFLEAAIQQRYALSESHVAYTQSLKGIGPSLHSFINHHHRFAGGDSLDPEDVDHSPNSDSGSGHIEFDSDSDEIDSLHHSDHSSPLHLDDEDPGFTRYPNSGPPPSYSGSYLHMNYMKNSSMPPSVVYEQRPSSPQRVYIGESSNQYLYPPNSSNPYFGYPNYGPGPSSSSSKPKPPPSPPKSEAWDFLNLFDYAPYTLSRDSRELREEECIPDLEEVDFQHEVVKEVHGKQKFVAGKPPIPAVVATVDDKEEPPGKSGGAGTSGGGQASLYQTRPSVSVEKEEKEEYEVHLVEKKVVEDGGDKVRRSNAAPRGGGGGGVRHGVPEVAKEIEVQFLRAAESGSEIAVMLEVGKHPYGRKHASSKMIHGDAPSLSVVSSSQPSTSKKDEASSSAAAAPTYADIEAELALRSRNLSSTLHKLHLWEKKLYDEVKAEEKLRMLHEKK